MTVDATEEGVSPSSGTGAGMIAFLNHLIKRNEIVKETAVALRSGCKKVLEVEDDPNNVDIRNLDVDNLVLRFRNRYRGEMAERSINNYDQRFRSTVEMYRKWLVDDPTWRPKSRGGGAPKAANSSNGNGATKATGTTSPSSTPRVTAAPIPATPTVPSAPPAVGLITYPFPIRPGVQGTITLPEDLSPREAQRIGAFISTLAFDEAETRSERLAITTGEQQQ